MRLTRLQLTVCVIGVLLLQRADATEPVSVCIDSASRTASLDERVARAALRTQGVELHVVQFVGIGRGGDGFPVAKFARMARSDCQLIMGFPVDTSNPNLPPEVKASRPYARTGFVLVRRRSEPAVALGALPKGSEVGIARLDTYAGLLYTEHPNLVMHVYPDDAQLLADLRANRIVAALGWQPSIEFFAAQHFERSVLHERLLSEPHMRWDLVALYASASSEAAALFERGLARLRASGALQRLISPFASPELPAGAAVRQMPTTPRRLSALTRTRDAAAGGAIRAARRWEPERCGASAHHHVPPPALYTEEQAKQGFVAYEQNCGMCHGPLLTGQKDGYPGPALKGAAFADPSYNFHVSEIFNFIAKLMPPGTPGSLTHDEDVVIMAYILQQNGYPAGKHALTYEEAEKSKIPIRYYGKSGGRTES